MSAPKCQDVELSTVDPTEPKARHAWEVSRRTFLQSATALGAGLGHLRIHEAGERFVGGGEDRAEVPPVEPHFLWSSGQEVGPGQASFRIAAKGLGHAIHCTLHALPFRIVQVGSVATGSAHGSNAAFRVIRVAVASGVGGRVPGGVVARDPRRDDPVASEVQGL